MGIDLPLFMRIEIASPDLLSMSLYLSRWMSCVGKMGEPVNQCRTHCIVVVHCRDFKYFATNVNIGWEGAISRRRVWQAALTYMRGNCELHFNNSSGHGGCSMDVRCNCSFL